jgi:hypothetical protein
MWIKTASGYPCESYISKGTPTSLTAPANAFPKTDKIGDHSVLIYGVLATRKSQTEYGRQFVSRRTVAGMEGSCRLPKAVGGAIG